MAHFSIQKKRDQYRKQGVFHTNKDLAQKVKERLEQYTDQPITEIVDFCVGGGGLLESFGDDVAKFGCDIESEFIEYTRENHKGDFRVDSIFNEPFGDKKFTHIVGNYPFSIKGNGIEMTSKYAGIYPYQLPNILDSSFVLANLKALTDNGTLVLISSNGLFYRGNKEMLFRKYLLERNLIEHIESIPADNHFDDTKIETTLVVLKKNRTKDTFTAHNTQDNYTQEINRHDILANDSTYNLSVSTLAHKPAENSNVDTELEFNENLRVVLESSIKNIETTIKMYKLMSDIDIRQPPYYREYLRRANAIITEALKDLETSAS